MVTCLFVGLNDEMRLFMYALLQTTIMLEFETLRWQRIQVYVVIELITVIVCVQVFFFLSILFLCLV